MHWRRNFLFIVFLLEGCAFVGVNESPGPYYGGHMLGEGTYIQDVVIEVREGEALRFQGIFQRKAGGVLISGLSVLGVSAFRVKDSLLPNSGPRLEIFAAEMMPFRDHILSFYNGLRVIFLLDDVPSEENEFVKERYADRRPKMLFSGGEAELLVSEYDWEGHALRLTMSTPRFRSAVSFREYTPVAE